MDRLRYKKGSKQASNFEFDPNWFNAGWILISGIIHVAVERIGRRAFQMMNALHGGFLSLQHVVLPSHTTRDGVGKIYVSVPIAMIVEKW